MRDPIDPRTIFWTREEARAYDRRAIDGLGIPGLLLMENAARGCALAARALVPGIYSGLDRSLDRSLEPCLDPSLDPSLEPRLDPSLAPVHTPSHMPCPGDGAAFVCCGPGQNGGDGYAIARILVGWGVEVVILALGEPPAASDAGAMRAIAERLGIPIVAAPGTAGRFARARPRLVVDALFGTGLARALEGEALELVRAINGCGAPVLAVDLPSGLDCDRGEPNPECVRADLTVTMVAMKAGFRAPGASRWTGRCVVVDAGGPAIDRAATGRAGGGAVAPCGTSE